MGAAVNTAINTANQTSVNSVFQQSTSICDANCTQLQQNVNVVISNGSDVTTLDLSQQCTPQASCSMRTVLKAIADQELDSSQVSKASAGSGGPGFFGIGGFSANTTENTLNQTLENNTTQIINSVCSANSEQIKENINILVTNDSRVGKVDLSQVANPSASCAISSSASATATQKETNSQSADSSSGSALAGIIVAVVVVFFLLYLLYSNAPEEKKAPVPGPYPFPSPGGYGYGPIGPAGQIGQPIVTGPPVGYQPTQRIGPRLTEVT